MKIQNIRWSLMALGTCAALLSTSAHAVWTFDQTNVTNLAGTNGGDPTLSLSGVYTTNNTSTGAVNGNWTAASLSWYQYNGQGMSSDGSQTPNHALDNNGNTEAVLLKFGASTVLTSIGLGYTSNGTCYNSTTKASKTLANDQSCSSLGSGWSLVQNGQTQVDVSLFRWTGTGTPTGNPTPLVGQSSTAMAGWELVGNYGDMVTDTSNPYNLVNSSGKTSSWWLISAYNSGFSQTASESRGSLDNGGDYFKLYSVAGTKCTSTVDSKGVCGGTTSKTPEPATLALTSVALLGVAGLRRRQVKASA
ncbi:PEP-CTERM sorting domain-containing protein [Pelomonas cellulosilytica]|uniref:PEP-CTERM sorting domain-containing protein n=1 Tax=Pelomonas cellulosilytica TaxID=2906762 RepID=A0ABS8XTC2_9BURK|nr:PEP-CTERM sorting domain-containing protein [Pelomonas sp. P8]MCE4555128.1 PEP-CTERM sorting domain-containing protein [Pelomonas sp. P8]